ncbi:sigma-B regulation protein RsbQ [Ulvibacter sp. MAR_2010_11]|uniref:alpha/beta fold hydrolase n=1 Tax=Ulvibacter sp. MAR_2010_11 TaxID=1250229 RepID=UPI000C2B8D76|nr:alpha/beta hydrolase [Ulvibacter sp. MAR_2010_11]PKA84342.1 sigma-B regulation protein RsbQ [Ulvibacter sp. MAR_2010_11]
MSKPQNSDIIHKFNINILGSGFQPMVFAHGYGCDQNMWRFVYPHFEDDYKIVLFDYIGAGKSDIKSYSAQKYSTLQAYADDVISICEFLKLEDVIFIGHSVSAMIGVLAANTAPTLFSKLIMLGPSPRYINDTEYVGGFEKEAIEDLMEALDSNYLGWSASMAPVIMGNPDRPELGIELKNSFCQTDPEVSKNFARVTFLSDNRSDIKKLQTPSLILQCSQDVIAPTTVGEYVAETIKNSTYKLLNATGHCPNLSAPEETVKAIKEYLQQKTGE